jgi:hypothetical protein
MWLANSDGNLPRLREAWAWVEAQMHVQAQSRAIPNVFNAGIVVTLLI